MNVIFDRRVALTPVDLELVDRGTPDGAAGGRPARPGRN
jgi:hypothetical protein